MLGVRMAKWKPRTLDQLARMRDKAVSFLRRVAGEEDRAAEFEAMSPAEYAAHKGIEVQENPLRHASISMTRRKMAMAGTTKSREELMAEIRELKAEVRELEEQNEELSDRLDQIQSLADTEGEEDEEEEVGEGGGEDEDGEEEGDQGPDSDDDGGVGYIEQD
jgi:chromosome segregation ATPase